MDEVLQCGVWLQELFVMYTATYKVLCQPLASHNCQGHSRPSGTFWMHQEQMYLNTSASKLDLPGFIHRV